MADEPEGGTKMLIKSTVEKLETTAGTRDRAVATVKAAHDAITANKEEINRLEGQIRRDQNKLPELEQNQQSAQDQVDDLLSQLEEQVGLDIERIDPSGPVVQGGTAKYKATHSEPIPRQARLSWDTGGCPFSRDGNTITVETGAVGPGDYNISVNLEWVTPADEPEPSVSTKSSKGLRGS